jgi:hypothetical protein
VAQSLPTTVRPVHALARRAQRGDTFHTRSAWSQTFRPDADDLYDRSVDTFPGGAVQACNRRTNPAGRGRAEKRRLPCLLASRHCHDRGRGSYREHAERRAGLAPNSPAGPGHLARNVSVPRGEKPAGRNPNTRAVYLPAPPDSAQTRCALRGIPADAPSEPRFPPREPGLAGDRSTGARRSTSPTVRRFNVK